MFRCRIAVLGTVLLLAQSLISPTVQAQDAIAPFHLDSACDFTAASIRLIEPQQASPDLRLLEITLTAEAGKRLTAFTRQHVKQQMALYINQQWINTVMIQQPLDTADLRIALDDAKAEKLFPSLLHGHCRQTMP